MRRILLFVAVVLTFQFNLFADTAYVNLVNDFFGTMDLNTGAFTQIGNSIGNDLGLALSNGALYSIDGSGNLIRINQSNGAITIIGNTGISTLTKITAMVVRSSLLIDREI